MRRLLALAAAAWLSASAAVVEAAPERRLEGSPSRPWSPELGEISAEGMVGSGIDARHGLAIGARLGHTTDSGLYLGASATRFQTERSSSASTLLLGGDIGAQLGRSLNFEVRPYAFVGASFSRPGELSAEPNRTELAFAPGLVIAPHFGPFYVVGEGRLQILPSPVAVSFLGGAGFTF
jgi:hypothetical protein